MKYHNITKADMLNGEGLRVVLWVSGCNHKCPGCQNALTWDENDGVEYDDTTIEEIYHELKQDWCSGITLSGGDPLFPKNRESIRNLVMNIKELFPTKTIWSYTGYTFEELMEQQETDSNLRDIINHLDVVVDGRFVLSLKDDKLHYVGSSNQRIIDVKKSIEKGEVVIYKDIHGEIKTPELNTCCCNG